MTYTPNRLDALDSLIRCDHMTVAELREDCGWSDEKAKRTLGDLVRDLSVDVDTSGGKGPRRAYRYRITTKGRAMLGQFAPEGHFAGVTQ